MEVRETGIEGLLLLCPKIFEDERGYFFESFNDAAYKKAGLNFDFIQDNISKSKKNTIRGLHFQTGEMAQGKLCQVVSGKVLDVAVDIRIDSPTLGKHYQVVLSEENHLQVWMNPGFAHGFAVLSEVAIFSYKCTQLYSREHESAILYNDPDLNIDWKVDSPILSEKDLQAHTFREYIENVKKSYIYNSK
jgi:dTDP-4-dehydrorhamnose 3,5-epimerase